MELTGTGARQDMTHWAEKIRDLLAEHGDVTSAEQVGKAIGQFESDRFMIAVLGTAKRGKSTLLNALMGRHDDLIAPIDKLPASSTITRFTWAEREKATVVFRDGRKEEIGFERVRHYVTEEGNPKNSKEVSFVEVEGPFAGLDRDVVLVDTPGTGSINEYHDQILHAFIPQADAVIFLVTARMPMDQDELELLQQVKKADIRKIFFALNKTDECNERDTEDAIAHNRGVLGQIGIDVAEIHRISAKRAFQGDMNSSGLPALGAEIQTFLEASKGKILRERLAARVCQLAQPVAQAIAMELASGRRTTTDLDTDLSQLHDRKRIIENDREFTEREFTIAWRSAVDKFESSLSGIQSEVEASMLGQIHSAPLTGIGKLAKDLPTTFARTMGDHLGPASQELETSLRDASSRLQTSYPSLDVQPSGQLSVRLRKGNELLTGAGGGLAMAAGGIGVATAAAAAAAAATTTVTTVAPLVAGTSSLLGWLGFSGLGSLVLSAGSTSTTVAASAPLWCAIAGPVGWSVAGLGLLMIPLAWRKSKIKTKDHLEETTRQHLTKVLKQWRSDRIPSLRRMANSILEDFRLRLDRQLSQVEAAIVKARDHRPSESRIASLEAAAARLQSLLAEHVGGGAAFRPI